MCAVEDAVGGARSESVVKRGRTLGRKGNFHSNVRVREVIKGAEGKQLLLPTSVPYDSSPAVDGCRTRVDVVSCEATVFCLRNDASSLNSKT
jgi:hypothetical protein